MINYRIILSILLFITMSTSRGEYYRKDGVRITHDPYSPEMAEKYGLPGETDREGFDPYADTVGPGIYGGIVKRDDKGDIMIGEQYQNHNSNPGPIYAGGGMTIIIIYYYLLSLLLLLLLLLSRIYSNYKKTPN